MIGRVLLVCACLLTGTIAVARARPDAGGVPPREALKTLPPRIGGWQGRDDPQFEQRIVDALGVDEYVSRLYVRDRANYVGLYIGYYRTQAGGDTIHSPLNCLPGSGWEPVSRRGLELEVARAPGVGAEAVSINRYLVRKGADRQLVLYWYHSQGRVVASEYASKLYLMLDAVRRHRTDAALVRVITPVSSDDASGESMAQDRAAAFVRELFPWLERYIPS
jgi:EpsI family protein